MSFTDYREFRRSLVKSGIQHYSSGSSHWRDVWESVTMPQTSELFDHRHLSPSTIRKDLKRLWRSDPEVIGITATSGENRFRQNVRFYRSG